jgi:hypothetical protein
MGGLRAVVQAVFAVACQYWMSQKAEGDSPFAALALEG